jgi:hypothetical protein
LANAAADYSSSEEVVIRRKPLPKPPAQLSSDTSSEDESEHARAASLGLRVRAKVNYKEKGMNDIFKSDDEDRESSSLMQVLVSSLSFMSLSTMLAFAPSKTLIQSFFHRRRRRRSLTATAIKKEATPARPAPRAAGVKMTTMLWAPKLLVEEVGAPIESTTTMTTMTIAIGLSKMLLLSLLPSGPK